MTFPAPRALPSMWAWPVCCMAVTNPPRMPAASLPIGPICRSCWEIEHGIKPGCHWAVDHHPADRWRKLCHVRHRARGGKRRQFTLDVCIKGFIRQTNEHTCQQIHGSVEKKGGGTRKEEAGAMILPGKRGFSRDQ